MSNEKTSIPSHGCRASMASLRRSLPEYYGGPSMAAATPRDAGCVLRFRHGARFRCGCATSPNVRCIQGPSPSLRGQVAAQYHSLLNVVVGCRPPGAKSSLGMRREVYIRAYNDMHDRLVFPERVPMHKVQHSAQGHTSSCPRQPAVAATTLQPLHPGRPRWLPSSPLASRLQPERP